jgi:tetratricopeptide (TPR) repeat protein
MLKVEELEGCLIFRENPAFREDDLAVDQAIDAWHGGHYEQAESILQRVIARNPFHIDAMHHLALLYDLVGESALSYMAAQAAVSVGLQALPAAFSWDKAKLEWGYWGNRPFMRAYHHLGLCYLGKGEVKAAIEIFARLLAVNPMDNQGVRYLLPKCWFELDDPWNVTKHCRQYQDDSFPEMTYSHPLALLMMGEHKLAAKLLQEAVNEFPLVAKELLKKRHARPKGMRPGSISYGGADQAYTYWQQYGKYWEATPAAMEQLMICMQK